MVAVEGEIHKARVNQMDPSEEDKHLRTEHDHAIQELLDSLLEVEVQVGTMVFEDRVRREVEATLTAAEGKGQGTSHGK